MTMIDLSRRDLFTIGGALGVTSVAAHAEKLTGDDTAGLKTYHATCSMECLHCNLKATVKDGKVIKIESDNPFDGKACAKGLARIKWMYAKNRVLHPMKRVGERGSGKFVPISWDEALDTVAAKMKEAVEKDGAKSIFFTHLAGNMDAFAWPSMSRLGDYLGGTTTTAGSLCCSAVAGSMIPMVGFRYVDTRDTIEDSKYIICWGNNPLVTMQAYWPRYLEAQKRGAKIVVIDPRKSETAQRADQWIQIEPGTDTALALGMVRILAHEKMLDEPFLRAHTGAPYLVGANGKLMREKADDPLSYVVLDEKTGKIVRHDTPGITPALTTAGTPVAATAKTALQLTLAEAEPWTPEAVQAETTVPAATVVQLAREFGKSGASMIVQNMGSFQRTEQGGYAAGSHFLLCILTGNFGRPGTGVCDAGGVTQMAKFGAPIPAPKKAPAKTTSIPISKTGNWVLHDKPYKINVWYSLTTGLVGQFPNANEVIRAIKHVPFFVVAENLMTPTAMYADIVLPVSTLFEYKTLVTSIRTHSVQWSEQAVEPQGEAKTDYWIAAQLAKRLGFGEAFDLTPEQMAENVLKPSGVTLAEVQKGPWCPEGKKKWVPFKDGHFRTPNGKANIFVEEWQKKGHKPVVTFIRPVESRKGNPALAAKYPLEAIQRKCMRGVHTSHHDNVWISEIWGENLPSVEISRKDAEKRGLKDGGVAVVFNDRGEHRCRVVVTDIHDGVVCLENGWWQGVNGNTTSSVLTNDTVEPLGTGSSICSTLVEVRRA